MIQDRFVPPSGAFTRSVPVRFSHCDPAGIVYFPHYFDMFNGLIEDWYTQELGYDCAELIMGSRYGFPSFTSNAISRSRAESVMLSIRGCWLSASAGPP